MTDWRQSVQRALQRVGLVGAPQVVLALDGVWDTLSDQRHADWAAWCAAHRGRACTLWLAGSHLTDLVCEHGLPLHAPGPRADWARRVLVHYHGETAGQWPLLPWHRQSSLGVSALPGPLLNLLRAQAKNQGVHLLAVRPLWPRLLSRLLARRPALRLAAAGQAWIVEASADQAQLTRISLAAGQITAVHRRRLQTPWTEHLDQLQGEDAAAAGQPISLLWLGPPPADAVSLDVAETQSPPYRDLLPRAGGQGPDFLAPQQRPRGWSWVFLGTAGLVMALSAWDAQRAWQTREQAYAVALPMSPRPRAVVAPPAAGDPTLQRRIDHPWRDIFLATETPASAALNWLALDHQFGGELRLQGVAADAAAVQRVATTLRGRPAWSQVLVSRLEQRHTPAEGLSFEIVARLATTLP